MKFRNPVTAASLPETSDCLQGPCLCPSPIAARRRGRRAATERTRRCSRGARAAPKGATAFPPPVQVRPAPPPSCYSHARSSPASQRRVCTHSVRCCSLTNCSPVCPLIVSVCLCVARSSTGSVDLCPRSIR